jgi:hypothetical protein
MLNVLLSLALNATTPTLPPDGTYRYQTVGQGSTGNSVVTIAHTGPAVQIVETNSGTIMGIAATASATMNLDADLTPATYVGTYTGGGQNITTSVSFNGAGASETFGGSATNAPQTFALDGAAHFAIIDGAMTSGFALLPAQFTAWGNGSIQVVAPVYGRSAAIAVTAGAGARPPHVPIIDLGLTVSGSVPFTEWYNPTTLVLDEVDVPTQGVTIIRIP